jgi:glycosyltransferase involved in cell wall biosynthesis
MNDKVILKVCLVSGTYPDIVCGVGFHTYSLAENLASKGCQVYVITTRSNLISKHLLSKENPQVNPIIKKWNLLSCFYLKLFIENIQPDIIHFQLPVKISRIYTVVSFILFRLMIKKPIILTLHEFSEGSWLSKVRGLLLIISAPYIIFPNPNDLKTALDIFPYFKHKFFHIPIGPTLPIYEILKSEKPLRSKEDIAYLGILHSKNKDIEILFQAIAFIASKLPQLHFHILSNFSDKNPYHLHLKELANRLNITKNIIWYSGIDSYKIAQQLIRCKITCLPYSKGATFRRSTLLEALSAGTAVITTKTDLTPQELIHNENVYLIPPNNPLKLAEAVEHLYCDEELTEYISVNGQKFAQNFTWDKIAFKTVELYKKIMEK